MYSHERFVPESLREHYTATTSIPIFSEASPPKGIFGLLLDPHTGIPSPDSPERRTTISHASLNFILDVYRRHNPVYVLCFDQSAKRSRATSKRVQRVEKLKALRKQAIHCFYYDSHAPFLFTSATEATTEHMRARLISLSIPPTRFED
jgi:hypothetical protein